MTASAAHTGRERIRVLDECIAGEVSLSGHLYPGGVFTHILTNIGVTIQVLVSRYAADLLLASTTPRRSRLKQRRAAGRAQLEPRS